jgi:hypothetical protein
MSFNKGGLAMLRHQGTGDREPRRKAIAPKTKAAMVATLKTRGWMVSIHTSDSALTCFMKDSRQGRRHPNG